MISPIFTSWAPPPLTSHFPARSPDVLVKYTHPAQLTRTGGHCGAAAGLLRVFPVFHSIATPHHILHYIAYINNRAQDRTLGSHRKRPLYPPVIDRGQHIFVTDFLCRFSPSPHPPAAEMTRVTPALHPPSNMLDKDFTAGGCWVSTGLILLRAMAEWDKISQRG